ncbi:FtsX-like permease family protein [Alteromonadaceae bacterium M269]|nr:FtsX-like permease family protein [Alteromonadaceae bacterium M269]
MNIYKTALFNGVSRIFLLPRLSIPLILTLGLTLGAVLSVIAIASALMFQPLQGVKDETSIKTLEFKLRMSEELTVSYWNMRQLANFNEAFKHLGTWAGITTSGQDVLINDTNVHVTQHLASQNILDVLGTTLIRGQGTQIENVQDFIWISNTLWQTSFSGSDDAIGKQVVINDKPYAIAGIIEDLTAVDSNEPVLADQIWLINDLNTLVGQPEDGNLGSQFESILLKANNNSSPMPDKEAIEKWMEDYITTYTEEPIATGLFNALKNIPKESKQSDYRSTLLGSTKSLLIALFVAVSGLLVMAVINLLNLFIAHYQGRTKEFSIQLTLGASLFKMRSLIFLENLPSFLMAIIVGLLTAGWVIKALPLISGDGLPLIDTISIDLATVVSSLIIVFAFSLIVSALALVDVNKKALAENLSSSGKGLQAQSNQWLSRSLMVIQLSIASLLLTASVMLAAQSYHAVYRDLGYEMGNHYVVQIRNNDDNLRERIAEQAAYQGSELQILHQELDSIITTVIPNSKIIINDEAPISQSLSVSISNDPDDPSKRVMYQNKYLSAGYFEAFKIPFLAGSNLTPEQIENEERLIVIDETMAKVSFPDMAYEDIVGQPMTSIGARGDDEDTPPFVVNGIVGNTRSRAGTTSASAMPAIYSSNLNSSSFINITVGLPEGQAMNREMIENEIVTKHPQLSVINVTSLEEMWLGHTSSQRVSLSIVLTVTGLTLLLAAIGVAGLTQMATNHKLYELAIHMALGAKQSKLVFFIFKDATWMLLVGLGLGFSISVFGYQSAQQQISILPSFNWATMGITDLGLIMVVVLAIVAPAWRTIKADPMGALRQE